jgi:hypothetical protein
VQRPDARRGVWWLPAIVWAAGSVAIVAVGFGTTTSCTTERVETHCDAIGECATFGVIASGLIAMLPVSRSVREAATPTWITVVVGVVVAVAVFGMRSV